MLLAVNVTLKVHSHLVALVPGHGEPCANISSAGGSSSFGTFCEGLHDTLPSAGEKPEH